MTIYDVAREAGVSHQTVSRVINGRTGVAATTRQRVLSVAEQLRFVPNRSAQDLRNRTRNTLGCIVVAEPGHETTLSASFIDRMLSLKATILVRFVDSGQTHERQEAIDILKAQNVTQISIFADDAVEEVQTRAADGSWPKDKRGPRP